MTSKSPCWTVSINRFSLATDIAPFLPTAKYISIPITIIKANSKLPLVGLKEDVFWFLLHPFYSQLDDFGIYKLAVTRVVPNNKTLYFHNVIILHRRRIKKRVRYRTKPVRNLKMKIVLIKGFGKENLET